VKYRYKELASKALRAVPHLNMSFFRRPFTKRASAGAEPANDGVDEGDVSDGSLQFVAEKAGNDSGVSYQEASGAPVETHSPLGYNAGPVFIIFLNVGKLYSSP
jgi:hypothetical protein